jgi:inosose dehydratase
MASVLAAAPITWGVCELPGWGLELPYERVLDEMVVAGFKGTELGPAGYLPLEPATLRRALESRGLALVGAFCPLTLHLPAQVDESLREGEALARLLSELACPVLVAADAGDERRRAMAGRVGAHEPFDPDTWARVGEGLATLAQRCAPLGVRVAFHPHAGTYVETAAEVDALLAHTPAELVGLCLDTGHLVYGGADPVAVARRYASRVRHVHLKDVHPTVLEAARRGTLDYATAVGRGVFTPLGDGVVDVPGLIGVLQQAGYRGWHVLEQDVRLGDPWPAQDPLANARRSAAALRRLLGEGATP